jgi:hypothetical protein
MFSTLPLLNYNDVFCNLRSVHQVQYLRSTYKYRITSSVMQLTLDNKLNKDIILVIIMQ